MYNPSSFQISDTELIVELLRHESFGVFMNYQETSGFQISHLPFVVNDECTLVQAHMARANKHWTIMDQGETLLLVQGPHHYISSLWYDSANQVSTWNYIAIHLHGKVRLIHDRDELLHILRKTNEFFDGSAGVQKMEAMNSEQRDALCKAIVGVELQITKIEAKAKMSQNRLPEEREQVLRALYELNTPSSQTTAALIRRFND